MDEAESALHGMVFAHGRRVRVHGEREWPCPGKRRN
jgi:hypothetical protein